MASPVINRLRSIWRQYPDPRVFAWTLVVLARQVGYYSFKTNDDVFREAAALPISYLTTDRNLLSEKVVLDTLRERIEYLLSDKAQADYNAINMIGRADKRWGEMARFYQKLPFTFRYEWYGDADSQIGRFTDLIKWVAKEVNRWIRAGGPRTMTLQGGVEVDQHPLYVALTDLDDIRDWFIAARPRPDIMRMTMEQVSRAQIGWHNQMRIQEEERIAQMREEERKRVAEALKVPAIAVHGNYTLHKLTTRDQLKAEGCEQGICVGRSNMPYWRGVQAGTTEIYSVRNKLLEGVGIVATMEAAIGDAPWGAPGRYTAGGTTKKTGTIVQIKGYENADIEDRNDINAIRYFAKWLGYDVAVDMAGMEFDEPLDGVRGFVARFGRG